MITAVLVALVVAALIGAAISAYARRHRPLVVIGSDVPVPRATARQLRWRRRRLKRERRAHNPNLRSL